MNSGILKYNLLDPSEKKEVIDFIGFLFSKSRKKKKKTTPEYQNKILSVSTWDAKDIKVFEETRKQMNQWRPTTW